MGIWMVYITGISKEYTPNSDLDVSQTGWIKPQLWQFWDDDPVGCPLVIKHHGWFPFSRISAEALGSISRGLRPPSREHATVRARKRSASAREMTRGSQPNNGRNLPGMNEMPEIEIWNHIRPTELDNE